MPIPSSNEVDLDIYFKLTNQKILSFIHSIKHYIEQFEDNVHPYFHIMKCNECNDDEIAKIEISLNCLA